MRYGIFSDVHSNIEALEAVLAAYAKEAIDVYLCIGDLVGYAADPNECIDRIKPLIRFSAAGNHDWAAADLFSLEYFIPEAKEALIWTRERLREDNVYFLKSLKLTLQNEHLTLAHGTLHQPQGFFYMTDMDAAAKTFALLQTQVCFVGHSHIPGVFVRTLLDDLYYKEAVSIEIKEGNSYILNPGSVGQPRDRNPAAGFCVYDTEKKTICFKRVCYDFYKAREKIINAGLPRRFGDRLLVGK